MKQVLLVGGCVILVIGVAGVALSRRYRTPEWKSIGDVPPGTRIGFGQNPLAGKVSVVGIAVGVLLLVLGFLNH